MRTTQAFLTAKLIIVVARKLENRSSIQCSKIFWANRFAPKVINDKCFTLNGVTFGQRYSVSSNTTSWNVAIRHNFKQLTNK